MAKISHSQVILDRTEVSIHIKSSTTQDTVVDVFVSGQPRGTIRLGPYYSPSLGMYAAGELALWAGTGAALWRGGTEWREVKFDEPIRAVYRLRAGWCVVSELGVSSLDAEGRLIRRSMHDEVIISSWWEQGLLVLQDFQDVTLAIVVDEDTLVLGEIRRQP